MSSCLRSLQPFICGLTVLLSSTMMVQAAPTPATAPATAAAPTAPVDPVSDLTGQAIAKMNANDVDGALAKLTQAIALKPKMSGPYVLRAAIYCQKKQYDLAEADFKTAAAISPDNPVIQFNLVELKFMQKQFDLARPGYVALEKDSAMGDLASYKVFLCDLFGGHQAQAAKELAAFNDAGSNPSYYFGNAAWSLYHKNIEDARGWLVSASNIFSLRKNSYYAQPLRDNGYLPLPEPAAK